MGFFSSIVSYSVNSFSFSNLTITNGLSERGAGIHTERAIVSLDNVHIIENHLIDQDGFGTELGGGIYIDDAIFSMIDCVVSGNGGPGAYNTGGGLYLKNLEIIFYFMVVTQLLLWEFMKFLLNQMLNFYLRNNFCLKMIIR